MATEALMTTKVKNIYIMLLHAVSKENISLVDHYLDDRLTYKISQYIEENKANNVRQVFRQQNISNLVVVDENEESITLEADVKYITYFVNRKNNKYVSGDDKTREAHTTTLRFRKNDIERRSTIHCPNCGATLNINASSYCKYCNQPVDERFSHFVLYSIE